MISESCRSKASEKANEDVGTLISPKLVTVSRSLRMLTEIFR